jgi:parallel beta-helix repeat protein
MSEHLTGLFYTLEKAGLHLDPEGARDALWLALHVTEPLVQLAPPGPSAEQQAPSSERAHNIADLAREKLTTGREDDLISETSSQDTDRDAVEGGQVAPQFAAARRLRLPAAPALPGSREIMRSMRPLRRKAVSSISRWMDEEATVRRAVEEDIWLPVFRPVPERWLNLALVIDRSLSMIVWDAMVKELRRVLQGSGAFRSIQLWWLDTESEKLMLYARDPGRSKGPAARHLREVAGGGQRTLVTVLTDCVSRGWYNGNATRAIFNWSRSAPVSLLQVLPERMWSRTALGDAEMVRLRASDAAVTNAHLSAGTELPLSDLDIDPGIRQLQLPVVPLDPQSLNLLARMVAGTSSQWTPGVIISLDEEAGPGIEPMPPPAINPAERVQRFWNLASSQAIRLASILAASPVLNMDLLRIIRRELLPDAQLVHEAEVILGGLLKIRTPEAGAAQKDRAYELEFFKGVKSYLLNNATVNEVLAVLSKVAEHHEIPGINRQFIEMLVADPAAASGSIDSADSAAEPASANIAQVLERLGGAYARAVKRQPATEKQKAPPSSARGWQPRIVHQLQPAQPFIGRQHFLKLLTDWWERPEFEPPVKVVLGEGGAGKTALAAEFLKAIRPQRRKDAGTFVWSFHQEPLLSEFLRDCVAYFADRSIPADDEVWEYVADLESALTDGRQHLLILDGLEILAGKTAWSGSAPSSLAWLMDMIRHVTKASQAVRFLLTSRDLEFPEDWSVIKLDAMGFELTVAQDGTGDYKSIEEAVSAATSGSRITVRRGVYYENVELKPEIALTGDDIDSVVIDGRGRGWVVKAADGCTISGLTIQNSGHETGVSDCGVMVEACKDCTVSGNRIIRNGHYGIILRNCRARIVENEIAENEILGIYIDSGAEFEISANILADHRHSALDLNASDSKGIIRNNNLLNAEYGIYYGSRLRKPLPLSIINNIFYKNADAVHTPYPFAAEIGYNLFFANKQDWYDWDKNKSIDLESSNIFEDPLFINADAGDYHLSPESPARRAGKDGVDVGAFAFEDTADVTIREAVEKGKTRIYVSLAGSEARFTKFKRGVYAIGRQKPLDFINYNRPMLRDLGLTDSAINVMAAVSENEGNLDAVNTWDNSFMSFGMFQWSTGVESDPGELPALLDKIKSADEAVFQKYYGRHGLDIVDTGEISGFFTIEGQRLGTSNQKEQLRTPVWAFHFWLSGQDPVVQATEIRHALSRINTFYRSDSYRVKENFIADLVTSEYGVSLLLDNHVNRPGYIKPCLEKALDQTRLGDPRDWDTAAERKLVEVYLKIRETHGRYPMTDAAKRAAVVKRYLDDGILSDERGSFQFDFQLL